MGRSRYLKPSTSRRNLTNVVLFLLGHEIVATIAQMYLHPTVLPTLCEILDLPLSKCHIASVATWADEHRLQMRWSASLHYIGSLDDFPSKTCAFPGPRLWDGSKGINVLDGIQNTTKLLQDWVNKDASDAVASEALKFLIHFMGDMHQPLHLTGRERGGNLVKVQFGSRNTSESTLAPFPRVVTFFLPAPSSPTPISCQRWLLSCLTSSVFLIFCGE